MADWTKSMTQEFEYYVVDPGTWKDIEKLDNVTGSNISRDSSADTLGSASIDMTGLITECYVRIYLITVQNGVRERHPLGTYLIQPPSTTFDGKISSVTVDAYTPLMELKEKNVPLGYFILKDQNVMNNAYTIASTVMRAPLVKTTNDATLPSDFIANTDDTYLSFITDLIANAKYELYLDELGRVLFNPKQSLNSLQPVWIYNDDNSSILGSDISVESDLFGIPNVVEVVYSTDTDYFYARVVNDDVNSPTSVPSRGREITKRISNPSDIGNATQHQIEEYASLALEAASTVEYKVSYTHGYCPVRLGDCVQINYERAGIKDVKAKVTSQSIDCKPGCEVSETAAFTARLWGSKYGIVQ